MEKIKNTNNKMVKPNEINIRNDIPKSARNHQYNDNLIKYAAELSQLSGQEVLLIIYDNEQNQLVEYRSSKNFDVNFCRDLVNSASVKKASTKKNDTQGKNNHKKPQNCNSISLLNNQM